MDDNTSGKRKPREPRAPLMKWTDTDWKMTLLYLVQACGEEGIRLPFDKVGSLLQSTVTSGALQQALLKLKEKMKFEGRDIGRMKMTWRKRGRLTRTTLAGEETDFTDDEYGFDNSLDRDRLADRSARRRRGFSRTENAGTEPDSGEQSEAELPAVFHRMRMLGEENPPAPPNTPVSEANPWADSFLEATQNASRLAGPSNLLNNGLTIPEYIQQQMNSNHASPVMFRPGADNFNSRGRMSMQTGQIYNAGHNNNPKALANSAMSDNMQPVYQVQTTSSNDALGSLLDDADADGEPDWDLVALGRFSHDLDADGETDNETNGFAYRQGSTLT